MAAKQAKATVPHAKGERDREGSSRLKHACPIIFFYFYVLFTLLPGRIDFHQDVHLVDAQARRYSQIESWSQKIRRCLSAIEAPVLAPDD